MTHPNEKTASPTQGETLDFEPQLSDGGFGPERSIRWIVTWFYKHHLGDEKGVEIADRYFAALSALDRTTLPPTEEEEKGRIFEVRDVIPAPQGTRS